jgi:hypothetical protein
MTDYTAFFSPSPEICSIMSHGYLIIVQNGNLYKLYRLAFVTIISTKLLPPKKRENQKEKYGDFFVCND